jgi:hypothetical protein
LTKPELICAIMEELMALNQSARHRACRRDARKIALCIVLTGFIAAAPPSQAQTSTDQAPATSETPTLTPTPAQSPTPENDDVRAARNPIASGDKPSAADQAKADRWGAVPTEDVSLVNFAPFFLQWLCHVDARQVSDLPAETS